MRRPLKSKSFLNQSPLLKEDDYDAKFLLEYVKDEYPDSLLRTLQQRVKEWRELNGVAEDKEVMFLQEHKP